VIKKSSNKEYKELPDSWKVVKLGDVIDIQGGSQPPKKHFIYEPQEGYVRLLQIRDFGDKPAPTYVPKDMVTKFCTKEDIFIARYGASLGRIVTGMEGAYNVALAKAIFDKETFFSKYLFYLLQTPYFQTPIHMISRSAQNGFNKGEIFPIEIPLAPINEQKRIVAEIEKQFSRLDEAVENLKRVKANLKRYKASVLKAAVEGRLTEEWREKHPRVEPADKLLGRILAERHKKWEEAELAKMKAKGKMPKDDKWQKKYKEPSQADISTLDELPNGWNWLTSDQLFWFVTSGSRGWSKYYSDSGAVFLRIGNLDHDTVSLDLKKVQFVKPPRGAEGTRTRVEENDILISITADVGMIGVVPRSFDEAYINQHISLARSVSSVNSLYIAWYLTSRLGQNQFIALQRGATKAGLGLDDIRSVNIPMPPFEEQEEIISQMEKRLSVVDEIEIEADKNLKRSVRLRQSILKKAFSGRLIQSKEA
jgi:type I restriction enzyme S subunit